MPDISQLSAQTAVTNEMVASYANQASNCLTNQCRLYNASTANNPWVVQYDGGEITWAKIEPIESSYDSSYPPMTITISDYEANKTALILDNQKVKYETKHWSCLNKRNRNLIKAKS